MTQNVGDSGLRFEIWFRRRRKSQDTDILQASSAAVQSRRTDIIGRMLCQQALRSRELRIQELASMGIGNKPLLDVQPSSAAVSGRALGCTIRGTESQARGSTAVPAVDHAAPFKRPHSTVSDSSSSSSSSQASSILGSPGLLVSASPTHPGLWSPAQGPWSPDVRAHVEEDEPELETGTQAAVCEGLLLCH
ncbi:Pleckstrin homology domain-containing family G member 4B [Plecturocebus cupreus]